MIKTSYLLVFYVLRYAIKQIDISAAL